MAPAAKGEQIRLRMDLLIPAAAHTFGHYVMTVDFTRGRTNRAVHTQMLLAYLPIVKPFSGHIKCYRPPAESGLKSLRACELKQECHHSANYESESFLAKGIWPKPLAFLVLPSANLRGANHGPAVGSPSGSLQKPWALSRLR